MSPLVMTAPASARADRVGSAIRPAIRRMRWAASTSGSLLTKRRPVDFGLVTSCLCRCA